MIEWIGLSVLFLGVAGGTFVGLQLGSRRRERQAARLADPSGPDSASDLVLGELTPLLGDPSPSAVNPQRELRQELRDAGFYQRTALMEYTAVRALLVFVPILLALLAICFVPVERIPVTLLVGLCGSILGFSVPRLYINYLARLRAHEIEGGLPVAVDLLVLALSAGQNILTAFRYVSRELRHSYPVLSLELNIVSSQADLRSLEHALHALARRVRVPEVQTLAMILVQSERLGSDVATSLAEFAASFRTTLKQRAESAANRASFWMVFPTILCLWVPAAALLFGPVYWQFYHQREQSKEAIAQQKKAFEERRSRQVVRPETSPGNVSTPP